MTGKNEAKCGLLLEPGEVKLPRPALASRAVVSLGRGFWKQVRKSKIVSVFSTETGLYSAISSQKSIFVAAGTCYSRGLAVEFRCLETSRIQDFMRMKE